MKKRQLSEADLSTTTGEPQTLPMPLVKQELLLSLQHPRIRLHRRRNKRGVFPRILLLTALSVDLARKFLFKVSSCSELLVGNFLRGAWLASVFSAEQL